MIAYLKGRIIQKSENLVVVEVNNVGYEVNVSMNTFLSISSLDSCELYTYLQVKEDGISLFGFSTLKEKDLFLKLITVNGVGPKMAITILSGASVNDLTTAIITEDALLLSRFKGVGKKTAERIVLELKEKLSDGNLTLQNLMPENVNLNDNIVNDTINTLITLGLSKNDALNKVKQNLTIGDSVETLLEKILKNLSR